MKKRKLKLQREVILHDLQTEVPAGGICTVFCTLGLDCGQPSGYIECLPNYTCGRRCIPF